jgi:hypothetical protein
MPLVCTQALRKSWSFAIRSSGAAGGGPAGNSGEGRGRSGRGRRGNGLRVASGRFGGSVGARSSWEGEHAGGPGRWPLRLPVPARGGGRSRQCAAGEASTGSQGGVGVAGRRQKEGEDAAHRAAPMAAGGGARSSGGRVWRGWLAGGSP